MKNVVTLFVLMFTGAIVLIAQEKGEPVPEFNKDTVFIFDSPRSLIDPLDDKSVLLNAFGGDVIFSDYGFGAGAFYQKCLSPDLFIFSSLYISGARYKDEFEYWDPLAKENRVIGKVNRLFLFPLTIGIQKNLFSNEIAETFRPYISGGLGPTFILSTPYDKEFFSAFGSADGYTRFSAFLGIGANIGSNNKTLFGVNIRYYYIPFGGNGLESLKNIPMKDFGGLFLSVFIGTRFK